MSGLNIKESDELASKWSLFFVFFKYIKVQTLPLGRLPYFGQSEKD